MVAPSIPENLSSILSTKPKRNRNSTLELSELGVLLHFCSADTWEIKARG